MVKDPKTLKDGALAWMQAKEAERLATEARREIEDFLISEVIGLSEEFEGSQSLTLDNINFKVTGRLNRKVDGDLLESLAREHGLTKVIEDLFKWEPRIKLAQWKATDNAITSVLAEAITTRPGRPSFDISIKEGK